jgi:hypothetical protein
MAVLDLDATAALAVDCGGDVLAEAEEAGLL